MIAFIDEHRDQFGVEAICRTLRATECGFITSRGYRAAKTRPASARALRDVLLLEEVNRIHELQRLRHQEDAPRHGPGRLAGRP